ncbi:cysteine--tRNA ligase [Hamiltosporidium magnivora]|uniref:cysteine--tRNA ligase n=1 Tax=Hamiltosporidium magnivora TaxID=148818 RepID=A0A4V6MVF1_9MICR|nr:cysteine--tRNA ligase [Hamiltosporidium magnivora]
MTMEKNLEQKEITTKLKLINAFTKNKDIFTPSRGNLIRWYICGPTVYDSPHLGHARTYVSFDIVRRVLENYFGYQVTYVMNITDIDDKIINKAKETKMEVSEACKIITKKYETEFFEAMDNLNVQRPTFTTRVTNYVEKIVTFIEKLMEKGFAYESEGSVYFDLVKYRENFKHPNFVNESAINEETEQLENIYKKKNKIDFVLWKKSKEGEPVYNSPWGEGRPGWHIECSAMASDLFKDGLDIHSGGCDLAFPHHENEIAQSQAFLNSNLWCPYFLHSGHLSIDGLKMSKSLKNFITVEESLKNFTPRQLRILFLNTNWWAPMTYKLESMEYSKKIEAKLMNFISISDSFIKNSEIEDNFKNVTDQDSMILEILENTKISIHEAFCDSINTFKVLTAILNLITVIHQKIENLSIRVIYVAKQYVVSILNLLGVVEEKKGFDSLDQDVLKLVCDFRANVRKYSKEKKEHKHYFELCDKLREDFKTHGYLIEDKGEESRIRKTN